MARKACPQCKQVTGASSKVCGKCGHEFAPSAEPLAIVRSKRCAMCGIVNAASVTQCQCGFDFDQPPEDLRRFYKSRRANAWVVIIVAPFMGLVGCLASALFLGFLPLAIVGIVSSIGASAAASRKALHILSATRMNLDALAEFPNARLLTK